MPPCRAQPCSRTRSGPCPRTFDVQAHSSSPRPRSAASDSSSRSRSESVCAAENVMRSREVPAGTVGGRIAGTKIPASRSAAPAVERRGLAAEQQRLDRRRSEARAAGPAPRPRRGTARRGRARVARRQGSSADDPQRGARGRGDGGRQRRRVDVLARALHQRLDQFRGAGDECAERAHRLAERAHEHRHVVAAETRVLDAAASVLAQHAEAVRVVHEQRSRRGRGRPPRGSRSGATSPSMLKTPSVATSVRPDARAARRSRSAATSPCG